MRTIEEEIARAKTFFDENKKKLPITMNWDLYLLGWIQSAWVFAKEEFDELKQQLENESNR